MTDITAAAVTRQHLAPQPLAPLYIDDDPPASLARDQATRLLTVSRRSFPFARPPSPVERQHQAIQQPREPVRLCVTATLRSASSVCVCECAYERVTLALVTEILSADAGAAAALSTRRERKV